jgi:hypothetical protein
MSGGTAPNRQGRLQMRAQVQRRVMQITASTHNPCQRESQKINTNYHMSRRHVLQQAAFLRCGQATACGSHIAQARAPRSQHVTLKVSSAATGSLPASTGVATARL